MTHETDLNLLERYRSAGDQQAFAEIVRRYAGAVFTTCVRILRDRSRADDVSQETFFRLARKPQAVEQSLGGWLHTAATRLSIDAVRSDSSRTNRELNYVPPMPSEATSWSEVSGQVDVALAELPDDQRLLLVWHFLQGKNQCDIASEIGASPATISRKLKAAVEALRVKMASKGVMVTAAALWIMMRDQGSIAAPVALMQRIGRITMLSGKGMMVAPEAMNIENASLMARMCWLMGTCGLGLVIFALAWFSFLGNRPRPAAVAPQWTDDKPMIEQLEKRSDQFRQAGTGK